MENFSLEELVLMQKLGIPLPKQKEYKIIKAQTICTLCKTITPRYFKMVRIEAEKAWVKDKQIYLDEEPTNIEIANSQVSTCMVCREVLMQKSKADLISMLINSRTFIGIVKISRNKKQKGSLKEVKI